jgi:hypothetical protein
VLSYTNHALDPMVIDIQTAGVPATAIVRLGGKLNTSTQALNIFAKLNSYKMSSQTWAMIREQKAQAESYRDALSDRLSRFVNPRMNDQTLLDYLEFSDDSDYFDAFVLPDGEDDIALVGKDNK